MLHWSTVEVAEPCGGIVRLDDDDAYGSGWLDGARRRLAAIFAAIVPLAGELRMRSESHRRFPAVAS